MLAPLRHPNVVGFYGIAIETQSVEIQVLTVLEICSNGDLNDYNMDTSVERGWEERVTIGLGIAKGLAYLHSKGIVHRGECPLTRNKCHSATPPPK